MPRRPHGRWQTGEFDYAWNLQIEKDVLERIARQGRHGQVVIYPGSGLEHLQLNRADPWIDVDGERSSAQAPHPFLTELLVRQAFNVAVDRRVIAEELYGVAGQPTSNFLNSPSRFQSPNTRWEFDLKQAAHRLSQVGWTRAGGGALQKDGRRLKLLYQTSVNPVRQKTQAIVKNALEQLGMAVDLKAINAGVFFSSDPGNPDSCSHFYADLQMYTVNPEAPDPQGHLNQFVSWEIAQKANRWAGRNIVRWANAAYDRLWKLAETELDPVVLAPQLPSASVMCASAVDDPGRFSAPFLPRRGQDVGVERIEVAQVRSKRRASAVVLPLWHWEASPWRPMVP